MTDITELFSRDPMKLTNENIDEIIEEMRAKRKLFESGAPAGKKKAPAKKTTGGSLDLDIKL